MCPHGHMARAGATLLLEPLAGPWCPWLPGVTLTFSS